MEMTERFRTMKSILKTLEEKYARTTGEKMLGLIKEINEFK